MLRDSTVSVLVAVCLSVGGARSAARGATDLPIHGISVGQVVVDAQGRASVDIAFASSNRSVSALQFDIRYPYEVRVVSVSAGSSVSRAEKSIATSNPDLTAMRILISGHNQNSIPDGVIATLSVQLMPGTPAGFHDVVIDNAVGTDRHGSAVFVPVTAGGVVIPGDGIVAPAILAVANAASYRRGAVAPGEIVVIGGRWLGAKLASRLQLGSDGLVATSLGETRVLFDGIPAPLVYTTQSQVSAIVPYAVDGRAHTALQVEYLQILSAPVVLPVIKTSPGIFTLNQSGTGQGAIVNQDGTLNEPATPAARGTVVSIYGTGEGQTAPAGVDGSIVGAGNLRHPLLPVTATIGWEDAEVVYAGSAGNLVSGLFQVNVRVPFSILPGDAVPVTVAIGESISQTGVTMAVR